MTGGRPLRRFEGSLDRLQAVAPTIGRELCLITVHTATHDPALSDRVRDLLTDAVIVQVDEVCADRKLEILSQDAVAADVEPDIEQLFRDYLSDQGTKGAAADRVLRTFRSLLAAAGDEHHPRWLRSPCSPNPSSSPPRPRPPPPLRRCPHETPHPQVQRPALLPQRTGRPLDVARQARQGLWLDRSDRAGAGVSVSTSTAHAPPGPGSFTSLATAFPEFHRPGQIEGIVIAMPDFPAFATRVREIVWSGL